MFNNTTFTYNKKIEQHPFHLVDPSPWPFAISFALLALTLGAVLTFHSFSGGFFFFQYGIFAVIYVITCWFRDVIREGTYENKHTEEVQNGLRIGFVLFIVSEIIFFFSFFWAFFHSSLAPAIEIGGVWPPRTIEVVQAYIIPLLNTAILLLSGVTITLSHHYLINSKFTLKDSGFDVYKKTLNFTKTQSYNILTKSYFWLIVTYVLGILFLIVQGFEYYVSSFTLSDTIYGSCFYILTGFHGFHVLVGTIFLIVCSLRILAAHFTYDHHVGYESAIWYWHFVDIVWLFLFLALYWWGGSGVEEISIIDEINSAIFISEPKILKIAFGPISWVLIVITLAALYQVKDDDVVGIVFVFILIVATVLFIWFS